MLHLSDLLELVSGITSQGIDLNSLLDDHVLRAADEHEEEREPVFQILEPLNRRGEPMVCSPKDALDMFFGCDLEYLIMEDVLVTKASAAAR